MYGTQTRVASPPSIPLFENDVKMYGTQTVGSIIGQAVSLRMM